MLSNALTSSTCQTQTWSFCVIWFGSNSKNLLKIMTESMPLPFGVSGDLFKAIIVASHKDLGSSFWLQSSFKAMCWYPYFCFYMTANFKFTKLICTSSLLL